MNDVESIEELRQECVCCGSQVLICSRHYAQRPQLRAKRAQKSPLESRTKLAHLMQIQRPLAVCAAPQPARQRGFQARLRALGTIDRVKRMMATRPERVQAASDSTLANPELPRDQHRHVRPANPWQIVLQGPQIGTGTKQVR